MSRARIALTGPPGGGKSTALQDFMTRLYPDPIMVPEVARYIKHGARLFPPKGEDAARTYERCMSQIRIHFENMAAVQERETRHIIIDRGIPDAAAYLPGGIEELSELVGLLPEDMYGRYDIVLFFRLPSQTIYEACKPDNPSRHETYEEALELEERAVEAWKGHPKLFVIEDGRDWKSRFERALRIVQRNT